MKGLKRATSSILIFGLAVVGGYVGVSVFENQQFAQAQEQVKTSKEELAHVEGLSSVFRKVGEAVGPSVVNIQVTKSVPVQQRFPFGGDEETLRRFFPDLDGDGEPDLPQQNPEQQGTGSGVIMEVSGGTGFIVTNNHVAGGATNMVITLADGRIIEDGKLVGADPKTDLAVIKIEADKLIPANWGNSDELQRGDWILAFGSPFNFVGSMTHGIVSALNRQNVGIMGREGYENFIQVDAPINPGNSGGPLVNVRGEVVGINTAIASRSGGFQGIGFAIPSNQAKVVYESLKESGKVVRGFLGVGITDVTDPEAKPVAELWGYTSSDGVFVEDTYPNMPAWGKLIDGDIVTKIDGKEISNTQELRETIARTKPGTEITMDVFRDGKMEKVKLTVGEQPESISQAMLTQRGGRAVTPPAAQAQQTIDQLGMRLEALDRDSATQLGVPELLGGAVITQISPNSPADKANFVQGMVITRVNKTPVTSPQDVADALEKADLAKGVALYVETRDGGRFKLIKSGS